MDKQFARMLDNEISRYRKALDYFAKTCDWKNFQRNAATLFDYLEFVELSLLKNKIYQLFDIIFVVLAVTFVLFSTLSGTVSPVLMKYWGQLVLGVVAASFLGVLFYLKLRMYASIKAARLTKRKEQFIKKIEDSFKNQLGADTCIAEK